MSGLTRLPCPRSLAVFGYPLFQCIVHSSLPAHSASLEEGDNFRAVPNADEGLCWSDLRPSLARATLFGESLAYRLVAAAPNQDSSGPSGLLFGSKRTILARRPSYRGLNLSRASGKLL
jgi:hypothetical protein